MQEENDIGEPPQEIKRYNLQEKKIYAKDLYFKYMTITQIARDLGINQSTLKAWVYGSNSKKDAGWKVDRELAKNNLLKELSSNKRGMVQNIVNDSIFLIHDFVANKKNDAVTKNKPIDLRTAEKVTSILMNLHTIVKEEAGKDDNADFEKPTSIKELQNRAIKADPFCKKEKVEVVEVKTVEPKEDDIIIDEGDISE